MMVMGKLVDAMLVVCAALEPLEELRLPALDGTLGAKEQQLLAEVLFWAAAYGMYTQVMSGVAIRAFRDRIWFKKAARRSGMFCENAQDDICLVLLNAVHHLFGGALMMTGAATGDMDSWKRGCLIEVGFELWDLVALMVGAYPHTHFVKPQMKVGTVAHHLPGLSICTLLLLNDLHANVHLQAIGAWLLFAGGFLLLMCGLVQTCDFDTQMGQAAFFQVSAYFFFIYARFVVFPVEVLAFVREVQDPAAGLSAAVQNGVVAGAVSMAIFNLICLLDVTPKTLRYVRRAFDSAVKLDEGTVPLSAAERHALQEKTKTQ